MITKQLGCPLDQVLSVVTFAATHSYFRLIKIYTALNNLEQAAEYRKKLRDGESVRDIRDRAPTADESKGFRPVRPL
jgi:hypothetical protein